MAALGSEARTSGVLCSLRRLNGAAVPLACRCAAKRDARDALIGDACLSAPVALAEFSIPSRALRARAS